MPLLRHNRVTGCLARSGWGGTPAPSASRRFPSLAFLYKSFFRSRYSPSLASYDIPILSYTTSLDGTKRTTATAAQMIIAEAKPKTGP